MSERKNRELLSNYSLYVRVRTTDKLILEEEIILEDVDNSKDSKKKTAKMSHAEVRDMNLMVRANKIKRSIYNFGIRSTDICMKPFFRFDSAGPNHRNRSVSSLALQSVSTPHFQYYDEKGYSVAYKSTKLKDDLESKKILEDINIGLVHFCEESKSRCNGEKVAPIVIVENGSIPFPKVSDDPLEGINFE